jgi:uncharacterized coiled-coil DUF342 family protein
LPVEVFTKDEIEKMVEEIVRKLLAEETNKQQPIGDIREELAKLSDQIAEISKRIDGLSEKRLTKAATPPSLENVLRSELGELADVLDIRSQQDQLVLRPRRYLDPRDFRTVSEVVRKHGGFWSSMNRTFIVKAIR